MLTVKCSIKASSFTSNELQHVAYKSVVWRFIYGIRFDTLIGTHEQWLFPFQIGNWTLSVRIVNMVSVGYFDDIHVFEAGAIGFCN